MSTKEITDKHKEVIEKYIKANPQLQWTDAVKGRLQLKFQAGEWYNFLPEYKEKLRRYYNNHKRSKTPGKSKKKKVLVVKPEKKITMKQTKRIGKMEITEEDKVMPLSQHEKKCIETFAERNPATRWEDAIDPYQFPYQPTKHELPQVFEGYKWLGMEPQRLELFKKHYTSYGRENSSIQRAPTPIDETRLPPTKIKYLNLGKVLMEIIDGYLKLNPTVLWEDAIKRGEFTMLFSDDDDDAKMSWEGFNNASKELLRDYFNWRKEQMKPGSTKKKTSVQKQLGKRLRAETKAPKEEEKDDDEIEIVKETLPSSSKKRDKKRAAVQEKKLGKIDTVKQTPLEDEVFPDLKSPINKENVDMKQDDEDEEEKEEEEEDASMDYSATSGDERIQAALDKKRALKNVPVSKYKRPNPKFVKGFSDTSSDEEGELPTVGDHFVEYDAETGEPIYEGEPFYPGMNLSAKTKENRETLLDKVVTYISNFEEIPGERPKHGRVLSVVSKKEMQELPRYWQRAPLDQSDKLIAKVISQCSKDCSALSVTVSTDECFVQPYTDNYTAEWISLAEFTELQAQMLQAYEKAQKAQAHNALQNNDEEEKQVAQQSQCAPITSWSSLAEFAQKMQARNEEGTQAEESQDMLRYEMGRGFLEMQGHIDAFNETFKQVGNDVLRGVRSAYKSAGIAATGSDQTRDAQDTTLTEVRALATQVQEVEKRLSYQLQSVKTTTSSTLAQVMQGNKVGLGTYDAVKAASDQIAQLSLGVDQVQQNLGSMKTNLEFVLGNTKRINKKTLQKQKKMEVNQQQQQQQQQHEEEENQNMEPINEEKEEKMDETEEEEEGTKELREALQKAMDEKL